LAVIVDVLLLAHDSKNYRTGVAIARNDVINSACQQRLTRLPIRSVCCATITCQAILSCACHRRT